MSEADQTSPQRWTRRPQFSPYQLLSAEQLTSIVESQREHSEMLMRALHGEGVIFGFAVKPGERECEEMKADQKGAKKGKQEAQPEWRQRGWPWIGTTKLQISCGMALDRHGRLLRWPADTLCYEEIVGRTGCPGTYTLMIHFAERRVIRGGCLPCAKHADWAEDGVVFTLAEGCNHADRSCPTHERCISWDDYICARNASGHDEELFPDDLKSACEASGELCQIECSDLWYDPEAGIPIACVWIDDLADDGCPERWGFGAVGATCDVRPYVYRTPLLYELIKGCQDDLAQVESLSWQDWLVDAGKHDWNYEVPYADLEKRLLDPDGLMITFSKPIDIRTVHPGSVFLTTVYWEREADYLLTRRIPAFPVPVGGNKYETTFRLHIQEEWVDSEVKSRSHFRDGGRIELTIRGQMLRDKCRNMLNSVPLFYEPVTPKQSQPGDDFYAVFVFGAYVGKVREEPKPEPAPKQAAPAPQYKF